MLIRALLFGAAALSAGWIAAYFARRLQAKIRGDTIARIGGLERPETPRLNYWAWVFVQALGITMLAVLAFGFGWIALFGQS